MKRVKKYFEEIKLISAVCLLIAGTILLFCGFFVNPTGVIDNSVLISFGEVLSFVGAIFGIHTVYSNKYKELIDSITPKNNDYETKQ